MFLSSVLLTFRHVVLGIYALGILGLSASQSFAQVLFEGYSCCNMRYHDDWISDANYREHPVLPPGIPTKVTSIGRNRIYLEMDGKRMRLGNDYSRNLSDEEFAKRWIWTQDPKAIIAKAAPKTQQAIKDGKLMVGMTREQVLISMGYPIATENPSLDAPVWRYWLSSFDEVDVHWKNGRVGHVTAHPTTLAKILVR